VAAQYYLPTFDPEFDALHTYAMLSIGRPEAFVNFHYGFWLEPGFAEDSYQILGMGGSYSFSPSWRLYVEGIAVWDEFDTMIFPLFMAGHSWRQNTFEFGLSLLPEVDFPIIPVLSYSLRFGS
jgi:hypothetical protein